MADCRVQDQVSDAGQRSLTPRRRTTLGQRLRRSSTSWWLVAGGWWLVAGGSGRAIPSSDPTAGPSRNWTRAADIALSEWDDVFAVNVRGVFLMCRAFVPLMVERGTGDVINLASVSGKQPLALRTPYPASKMAVIGLTTTLAHEVGTHGAAVNSLSPGPVAGPRMERNFALAASRTGETPEQAESEFVSRSALHCMVTEEEVAGAVVAMLNMPGLSAADIDLSAGMVAR